MLGVLVGTEEGSWGGIWKLIEKDLSSGSEFQAVGPSVQLCQS